MSSSSASKRTQQGRNDNNNNNNNNSGRRDNQYSFNRNSSTNKLFFLLLAIAVVASTINILFHHISGVDVTKFHSSRGAELLKRFKNEFSSSSSSLHLRKQQSHDEHPPNNGEIESSHRHNNNHDDGIPQQHKLSGLTCEEYGGPSEFDDAEEMIYWSDIPSDSDFKSPFYDENKYLTFEPDHGGWNNIRMAMETVLVMAHAMGRTLVLPPESRMYLLKKDSHKQKTDFSFNDFFHLDSLHDEHPGLDIITMEEFLNRMAMTGKLKDSESGEVMKPPDDNRVDWNGKDVTKLWNYLRTVGYVPHWDMNECVVAFPATTDPENLVQLRHAMDEINRMDPKVKPADYKGKPIPVDAPFLERLKETLADRTELCLYEEELQRAPLVHFAVDRKERLRLLIHFYSLIVFEDWRQDLWTKRFVRDHVRYLDELQCAAARVVRAVRDRAKAKHPDRNPEGLYDAFHVRRGDFQYKKTRITAELIAEISRANIELGSTVYIATDERDKEFFKPVADLYDICFLDDFKDLFQDLNTNYYGMLDQLVCTKSRVFFGTWFSSFSGYINRMRGYHVTKNKSEGYDDGTLKSWYFVPEDKRDEMQVYWPSRKPFYMREFPSSWRYIDNGIEELWDNEVKVT